MQAKKRLSIALLLILGALFSFGICKPIPVFAGEEVYAGGIPAGFVLKMKGVQIVGLSEVVTDNGVISPAKKAGLRAGDTVVAFDGKDILSAEDIESACKAFEGGATVISYLRGGERGNASIEPQKDVSSGEFRLGILIRDSVSGIGTVTYVKKDGSFGALGHPVFDESGKIMDISGGKSYECSIIGVNRGERGAPGELRGLFFKENCQGDIYKNTDCGLFGKLNTEKISLEGIFKKPYPVGQMQEVRMGKASILTTVDGGTPKEYSISIVKIDKSNKENKNFVIKITDKALLSETNGIVQGMSGSPIIQNGRIIGAVTHVFVNDPERGYGVSIEKMLKN